MQAGIAARSGGMLCLAFVLLAMLAPGALAQAGSDEELLGDSTMRGNPTTPTGEVIGPIYEKIIWASIAVFLMVAILLTYIVIRFRHRRGTKVDVPQIHGHSKLEIAWTIGPALVMFWLLVISYNGLLAIDHPGEDPEVYIDVVASQFLWTFTYSDGTNVSGQALRVQEQTWVQFNVTSTDVIHAFSVPGLDVMIDANPGRMNKVMMFAYEPGTYLVQCRQFCGTGHGEMLGAVEVFEKGTQPLPFGQPPRDTAGEPEPPVDTNVSADVTIDVSAFEYGFDPAPLDAVEPGQSVQFILTNDGNAPHNLFIGSYDQEAAEGTPECTDPDTCAQSETIGPGQTAFFVFTMPDEPIAYDVWCDITGHAPAGMLTYISIGGAEPDIEEFTPRLPGPSLALVLAGLAAAAFIARRRS